MIKNVHSGSSLINIVGGSSSMPYINSNYSGAGMIKYDSGQQCLQVNDGTNWQNIPNETVSIDLGYEVKSAIEWVRKKQREEMELENLAKENPAIADLVNQINEKKNQIEMVKTLIKKDDNYPEDVAMQAP